MFHFVYFSDKQQPTLKKEIEMNFKFEVEGTYVVSMTDAFYLKRK